MVLTGTNVLVTGGTGFIGSHLVKRLLDLKVNVIVPYLSRNPVNYFFSSSWHNKVLLVHSDNKNFKRTFDVVTKYEVDYIFHLAAQPIVTTAFHNPLETFETNIMGTANILEAARLYGNVRGIIVCSSDKAYGKIPKAIESKPLSGDHPYETSKAASDMIAKTYSQTYGLPVVITRFGNVYGEGDLNFSRIIPGVMKSIAKNEELQIRSNGKYIRDYVYVGDVVDAMILLSKNVKKYAGEAFNISSRENLSVIALIQKIEYSLKRKIKYKILASAINEIPIQSIDFRKIQTNLGWNPHERLNTKISEIHDWYLNYFKSSAF